ncbi:MAG: hypothetical protein NVV82_05145 [Sporocytophaga sp.]|nr:hypothetical protein [Sporocytophaga sp.]
MNRIFLIVITILTFSKNSFCQKDTVFYAKDKLKGLGNLIENKEDGFWTYWYLNGVKNSEGSYKLGIPVGYWQNWDTLGRIVCKLNWKDGLRHGALIEYDYVKNEMKIANFREDKLEGKAEWIHFDGYKILDGSFKSGLSSGDWTWYYPNGNVKSKGKFAAGKEDGVHTWFNEDGIVIQTVKYKKGVPIE